MEISKNKIKFVSSLSQKKHRDSFNVFVGEGSKLVFDLMPHFRIKYLFCVKEWFNIHESILKNTDYEELILVEDISCLKKISQLSTPPPILCVFYKNETITIDTLTSHTDLILVLDAIQDPGNLGTIIRSADWFGVKYIYCSKDTVDVYNAKVVQSSMGAIARVDLLYGDISEFVMKSRGDGKTVYGTFLEGENIYKESLSCHDGVLIMGNEGSGISPEVENMVDRKLNIPSYYSGEQSSESLNVSVATSIILSEFRRR